jgi:putative protease
MPRLREVIESHPDTLKIEGRNRSEYYVGSVTRAYRNALDAYARDPEHFDPQPFMDDLNLLETRGYTTAFFDGPLPPDAHDYETTHSNSDYQAAGVITNVDDTHITLELRNEIKQGDKIHFILPLTTEKLTVQMDKIINAANGAELPKMSAGQKNSLIIPIEKIPPQYRDKIVPLVLAYKRK